MWNSLSLLLPPRKGFRILMYHKISSSHGDGLAVTVDQFKKQIAWIRHQGFSFLKGGELSSIIKARGPLPSNKVLITFDDGYADTAREFFPEIENLQVPIVVFLPVFYIGKVNSWDGKQEKIVSGTDISYWSSKNVEFGLHSYSHRNYSEMSSKMGGDTGWADIRNDLKACIAGLRGLNVNLVRAFAYPYGGIHRSPDDKQKMSDVLQDSGITWSVRIGNRINDCTKYNAHYLQRIDVRGDEDFETFVRKFRRGRW